MCRGIVFVLEDYHVIATPEIHQSLTFLLDHLPPTLHLVITTRADPPLPLARLRARGQLSEIRVDDLRFTAAETALFLNERMGLNLSPDEVQLLAARTEGWIAGLQLAALSMRGHNDKASFLRSFSGDHRYILNYLIEEVLNQQPRAIQEFLLRTSILARLCGPLCDVVMGVGECAEVAVAPPPSDRNSQSMLAQLDQANLFLVPLDDLGQWFRYHQLFAEVLRHRLHQSQPEILPTLHHRASVWHAQQGYLTDAIHHALLAADFANAAALIEQVWPTLWNQGAFATLFNWMQALPDDVLPASPSLYVSYTWGLALTGQIAAAETYLQKVEATLQYTDADAAASATHNTFLGRATALRAMLAARRSELTDAVPLAEQALTLIPRDAVSRGDAYYVLGLAKQQQGALTEAFAAYEAAAKLGMAANNSFLAVAARYHEARILMAQGYLQKAANTFKQILTVADQARKKLPVVGLAHVGYGEVLYQWNDLTAAAQQVDAGLALSPRRDLTYTDGPLHHFSILARIRQAMDDREGAIAAIELAKETAQQTGIALDVERAAALEALIHLRLGELVVAARWAERYARTRTDVERFTYLHEFETLVFVRTLLAHSRVDEALALLSQWLPAVEATERQGSLLELCILQVLALRLDDQIEMATSMLARAVALAEPEGYVRLFVDEGEPMRLALSDLDPRQYSLLNFTNKLLRAFASTTSLPDEIGAATASLPTLIEPLTDREFEVLRLLAAGLSNAAIAEQLVVSVGTVKTHLKHIYGKLTVQSRTQAVAQARMLGLL